MTIKITIGTWNEPERREITHCPSYYAADHETLSIDPGEYDAAITVEGGYTIPMPYWLLIKLSAVRVSGATYSGFGGVNFASRELKAGESVHHSLQFYAYQIPGLVAEGRITLRPEFSWMAECKDPGGLWQSSQWPRDWDSVRALAAEAA